MKKLSEVFSEQHREKGRFKPTIPHMVANKATASPRSSSDSANVSLKERCWPGYKPKLGKQPYSSGSCVKEEDMKEDWSQKYKSDIDCDNPKGFSQKAHCQGRKK